MIILNLIRENDFMATVERGDSTTEEIPFSPAEILQAYQYIKNRKL